MTNKDPLHGLTLEAIVTALVDYFGWEELGQRIEIRSFVLDPQHCLQLEVPAQDAVGARQGGGTLPFHAARASP